MDNIIKYLVINALMLLAFSGQAFAQPEEIEVWGDPINMELDFFNFNWKVHPWGGDGREQMVDWLDLQEAKEECLAEVEQKVEQCVEVYSTAGDNLCVGLHAIIAGSVGGFAGRMISRRLMWGATSGGIIYGLADDFDIVTGYTCTPLGEYSTEVCETNLYNKLKRDCRDKISR